MNTSTSVPQKVEITADSGGERLDVFLRRMLPEFSRSYVRKIIAAGGVRVAGKIAGKAKYIVRTGDRIEVEPPPPQPAVPQPENIPVTVPYEDDDLLVVDKPAGLTVHPGAGARSGTLVNALLGRGESLSEIGGVMRPGIVHRLDKDTSGLLLVAKNDASHRALSAALARREIRRVYWTIALGAFTKDSGTVDAPIGRHPAARTKMCIEGAAARSARTHWRVLERFHGFTLAECRLDTGRTHQIRVHLAAERHPVLGDCLYGGAPAVAVQLVPPQNAGLRNAIQGIARQMLHARELHFAHPRTKETMELMSPLPEDFSGILALLRGTARG